MGKDLDPWKFGSFDFGTNVGPPAFAKQSSNYLMKFPTYADTYRFYHIDTATTLRQNPTGFTSGQKNFIVFDQSGKRRSLAHSSLSTQFPCTNANTDTNLGFGFDVPASKEENKEANVSKGDENEEMHEDTEEIDALLYSDSDDDYEEEDASTGHSPENLDDDDVGDEEVASSAVLQPPPVPQPSKRRRAESAFDFDPSLADTASSTDCGVVPKKAKRERIQETVGVLRRILPGGKGKGKDAAAVLDEAIRYLKSLRLKAKGLGFSTVK